MRPSVSTSVVSLETYVNALWNTRAMPSRATITFLSSTSLHLHNGGWDLTCPNKTTHNRQRQTLQLPTRHRQIALKFTRVQRIDFFLLQTISSPRKSYGDVQNFLLGGKLFQTKQILKFKLFHVLNYDVKLITDIK